MLNSHRHFFLYAKGHYQTSQNIDNDLAKICNDYLGHDLHSKRDRVEILIRSLNTINNPFTIEKVLFEVVNQSYQYNQPFDFGMYEIKGTDAVVIAVLKLLRHLTVDEINGELGEPDPSILPLH